MTVQAWLIFDQDDVDAAALINPTSVGKLHPRAIDNTMADQQGFGTLVGKFVAPARLLNDPDYTEFVTMCSVLEIRTMDSDVLFLPWDV